MSAADDVERATFGWRETSERLAEMWSRFDLSLDDARRAFVARDSDRLVRVMPPAVQPIGRDVTSMRDYLDRLRPDLGRQLVVLVRAGATALGLWRDDELLRHKVIKKYVVRGKGRAQPAHLKTKGKSRYGSRLRLQNARSQLVETNEKMIEWIRESGAFDVVLLSCPVRILADLSATEPPPPWVETASPPIRIPFHVHTPSFDELQRVRRRLTRGSIEISRVDPT